MSIPPVTAADETQCMMLELRTAQHEPRTSKRATDGECPNEREGYRPIAHAKHQFNVEESQIITSLHHAWQWMRPLPIRPKMQLPVLESLHNPPLCRPYKGSGLRRSEIFAAERYVRHVEACAGMSIYARFLETRVFGERVVWRDMLQWPG